MKNLKLYFVVLVVLITLFSCKKVQNEENKDEFGEAIYTDSFSPKEWENPLGRIKIDAVDKDIGKFINADTIDPRLRKIIDVISDFVLYIKNNNFDDMNNILTSSANNSFILRYNKVLIDKNYNIRISIPENAESETIWLDYKIMFPHASIISKIELEYLNGGYKISDFENKFFDDLENMFSK